VTVTVNLSR